MCLTHRTEIRIKVERTCQVFCVWQIQTYNNQRLEQFIVDYCLISEDKSRSLKHDSFFFFSFIFISWRLITLQYCSWFCHTLTGISHGVTCIPHPDPPSHLPLHPIPLGLPSAPGLSTCLMHPTWAWFLTQASKLHGGKCLSSQVFLPLL